MENNNLNSNTASLESVPMPNEFCVQEFMQQQQQFMQMPPQYPPPNSNIPLNQYPVQPNYPVPYYAPSNAMPNTSFHQEPVHQVPMEHYTEPVKHVESTSSSFSEYPPNTDLCLCLCVPSIDNIDPSKRLAARNQAHLYFGMGTYGILLTQDLGYVSLFTCLLTVVCLVAVFVALNFKLYGLVVGALSACGTLGMIVIVLTMVHLCVACKYHNSDGSPVTKFMQTVLEQRTLWCFLPGYILTAMVAHVAVVLICAMSFAGTPKKDVEIRYV